MFDKLFEVGTWAIGAWAVGQIIGVIFSVITAIIIIAFVVKMFLGGWNKW